MHDFQKLLRLTRTLQTAEQLGVPIQQNRGNSANTGTDLRAIQYVNDYDASA